MPAPLIYRFADLRLDLGQRRLERAGEPIELGKLTYTLLVALVEGAPNVLTHDELVRRVWGGRVTSPETITQRIKLLRDALQDDSERPRYVGLVRGQGYKLIPLVEAPRDSNQLPTQNAASESGRGSHRRAAFAVLAAVVVVFAAAAYLVSSRFAGPGGGSQGGSGDSDFEVVPITTNGDAISPAISPDGKYVVYAQLDALGAPTSLWLRQLATSANRQVVAPEPASWVVAPTVSPDANFIDYVKTTPSGSELWRVPFVGGTPWRFKAAASSPVGWSPDGLRGAFIRYDAGGNTSLVTFDSRGEERVLATREVPTYFVSLNIVGSPPVRPAWSPDGRSIAVLEMANILTHHIVFIDTETGEETSRVAHGSFVGRGLAWLGPSTLVVSQPAEFGQRTQLWRMTYPSGSIEPFVTNDVASYIGGIDVDTSRTRLVTQRLDVRTSVWVGDATGDGAVEVVPPTPYGGTNVFLSWAGERVLYDATLDGRPVIAGITPGGTAAEEVVRDAFHVAAAPDGETIVFGSAAGGREGLWKVGSPGEQPVQLVSGFAVDPVVTTERSIVFVSNRNGVQSPWIVPLDGGDATEIVPEHTYTFDVSPDGRRLASAAATKSGPALVVCELPRCSNRSDLPIPMNFQDYLRWTPDGKELAYVTAHGTEIWALPLDGGPPHAITRFGPNPNIGQNRTWIKRFGWSRDGSRLALVRWDSRGDIVLFTGLRP